jgi:uncharacterized membrane protein
MTANSPVYDTIFILHIVSALVAVVVLLFMRSSARLVASGASSDVQKRRFPDRINWAVRFVHVLPITGLAMAFSGDKTVSISHLWVLVGLVCYLAAVGHLEARTLPDERVLAKEVQAKGAGSPTAGAKLARSIDVVLLVLGVALVAMIAQF